jgi:glycerophosphoryl diester phosphodiesterase
VTGLPVAKRQDYFTSMRDTQALFPLGVEIIGHRGCAQDAPENTLASVHLAWEQGADAVEIDVFQTRDGQIVAHHDETTRKTAGLNRRVADQTLAELKRLDVGRWKHERYAGERIPTLAEVIATIPEGRRLFVEVKCGDEGVAELVRVFRESGKSPELLAVISFSASVMTTVKKLAPEYQAYWVVEVLRWPRLTWTVSLDALVSRAVELGVDGVDLGYSPPLDRGYVDRLHSAGLQVYIWTCNVLDSATGLRAAGVDGLTTDRPGGLRGELMAQV